MSLLITMLVLWACWHLGQAMGTVLFGLLEWFGGCLEWIVDRLPVAATHPKSKVPPELLALSISTKPKIGE